MGGTSQGRERLLTLELDLASVARRLLAVYEDVARENGGARLGPLFPVEFSDDVH